MIENVKNFPNGADLSKKANTASSVTTREFGVGCGVNLTNKR